MSILMMPNNMQKERMRKEDIKQTDIKEDSGKISDSANPDSTSKIIRFHPVGSSSDTSKAAQPNRIDTRPALTGIFRKNLLSRNLMVIINWFRMNVVTRKSNSRNLLRIQLETLKEYLQRKPLAGKTLTASQKMD